MAGNTSYLVEAPSPATMAAEETDSGSGTPRIENLKSPGRGELYTGRINNNFKGSHDKRRRILTPIPESSKENQMVSSCQPTIDLNQVPLPSQISLPESDDESQSTLSLEIRNTVEVGKMLGFDM
ncbi:unnamed protein product [Lactuca virosa]|uniref:Uncharacterized protein n=1 Tax=Lactuca virosa TaxID=75947 RepID=A0AAU9NWN6_9ASTR|nr:unnamed protein product [Lactuca virosa]